MGKALEEIDSVLETIERRQERGIYGNEMTETMLILQGQRAVIIALEDIAKSIRAR